MGRARKPCAEPGCPTLVPAGTARCTTHTRERDKARGTRQARGYGPAHQQERAKWAPLVATGKLGCWRCGQLLDPGTWHLGHDDTDRTLYRGPECVPCNTATAGRRT